MGNLRRHFRYQATVAMHLEPVDQYGQYLGADRRRLISAQEEFRLGELNESLNTLLNKVFDANSDALYVFYVLNHRMDFMWWLLESLMQSQDPRLQHDYQFRTKEDRKFTPPKAKESSLIAPLILGLYTHIDEHIKELQAVVKNSLHGKIFLYPDPASALFDATKYVTNLQTLAQSGVLPAKVLVLMIEKINLQATVLERLKTVFHTVSRSDEWISYQLSLSAGGLSFISDAQHPALALFSKVHVFMAIESQIMVCSGKVVSLKKAPDAAVLCDLNGSLNGYKVGIEFEFLTQAQQHTIELFLQRKELRDAMSTVAL